MLPDRIDSLNAQQERGLNAPTGAWCSLTGAGIAAVLAGVKVSMHLQVRGAP